MSSFEIIVGHLFTDVTMAKSMDPQNELCKLKTLQLEML